MTPEVHTKKQSSLISYIRSALAPSNKGEDIGSFNVSSPHIRSDPVPAGFRKQTPLPSAREEVCRRISIESRCSSLGNTNTSNTYIPVADRDELPRSAPNKLSFFKCDQLSLLQLSLSVRAPPPTANEDSEDSEWGSNYVVERASATPSHGCTPMELPGWSRMNIVEKWLEEQTSSECN
ncbi:uncharacterized protein TM35_000015070 [Trypanosoma theileri]|uniref:Uncharacterized protein n=1 Tax=Trypanosoma theileri TaxID=67003 RepID=A0A1X0PB01_9TRYP|nr:uncharacterized protein TM35_000015070 [Trypanosoma theileri]ORC93630.1 hypothetical protein TM35_000015070 [Trypanosoma theileri]